jgi:hypothetical protein
MGKVLDSRIRHNLEAHARRMKELIEQGLTPEDASRQALQDVLHPSINFEPQARVAIAQGQRETDFVANCHVEYRPAARKAYRKIKKAQPNG